MEIIVKSKKINNLVPIIIEQSNLYSNEIIKRIKLNNIFSEFENKASNKLLFFINKTKDRYFSIKYGNELDLLVKDSKGKCLKEAKEIINQKFYREFDLESERRKMKYKVSNKFYRELKESMRKIRGLSNKQLSAINQNDKRSEDNFRNFNKKKINSLSKIIISKNNNKIKFGRNDNIELNKINCFASSEKILVRDKSEIYKILNNEQKKLENSIEKYKEELINLINTNTEQNNENQEINRNKKLKINFPRLNLLDFSKFRPRIKNPIVEEEKKSVNIFKLLPYHKLNKLRINDVSPSQKKIKITLKNSNLTNITEPLNSPIIQNNNKNFHNTVDIVADIAFKEVSKQNTINKKREIIECILGKNEISSLNEYKDKIKKKSEKIKEDRYLENEKISNSQKYLQLSSGEKANLEISNNLRKINNIEKMLYYENNKDNNSKG